MTAGVAPQSSWILKPSAPPRSLGVASPRGRSVLPLPSRPMLSGYGLHRLEHPGQVPGAGGDGGGLGALGRSGAAADEGGDAGGERLVDDRSGEMKWTWASMAPAVTILPLPAMISVSGPMTRSGWTPSMVSGLPALPMPVIRPSRMPMSALTMPQWSMIDGAGDHGVGGALGAGGAGLAHGLADDLAAAEHGLVAGESGAAGAVLLDLDEQVGVGEPDAVAGGGAEQVGVRGAGELRHRGHLRSRRAARGRRARRRAGRVRRRRGCPGSKRTAVPAAMFSRLPRAAARSNSRPGLASAKW